ncbi:hypothetical protein KCU93_g418, partial [Aureobasidium melanogenum]
MTVSVVTNSSARNCSNDIFIDLVHLIQQVSRRHPVSLLFANSILQASTAKGLGGAMPPWVKYVSKYTSVPKDWPCCQKKRD